MILSIHDRRTRFLISIIVFFIFLLLVVPHFMDVNPPQYFYVLVSPLYLIGYVVKFFQHLNSGAEETVVRREGSPLDLLFGLIAVLFLAVIYPIITYLLLSLASKILRRKVILK